MSIPTGTTVEHIKHGACTVLSRSAHGGYEYSLDGYAYMLRLPNGDELISWPGEFTADGDPYPMCQNDGQMGLWRSATPDRCACGAVLLDTEGDRCAHCATDPGDDCPVGVAWQE